MSYTSERDRILAEVDDLDEEIVNYTEEELTNLKTRLLALLAVAAVGTVLQYYYRNLLNAINAEMDTFERNYLSNISSYFDKMWEFGLASAVLVAREGDVLFSPSVSVDQQLYKTYILEEARSASEVLRKQLVGTLTRALLTDGASLDEVVHTVAGLLEDRKVVSHFFSRMTSDVFGAYNIAVVGAMEELLDKAPALAYLTSKEWRWSKISRVNHAAMDGKTIPFNESFMVPGSGGVPAELMFAPHDPNAGAGQTANCRCSLIIHFGGKRGEAH